MTSEISPTPDELARRVLSLLGTQAASLAVAESLTGGRVAAALTSVPGASAVFRGGVVAYATDLKAALLGVDADLLEDVGAVDSEVARQMAVGVRARLAATYGLATTGVAGPDPQDGHLAGEVYLAVAGPDGSRAERLLLSGDRAAITGKTVQRALATLATVLEGSVGHSSE